MPRPVGDVWTWTEGGAGPAPVATKIVNRIRRDLHVVIWFLLGMINGRIGSTT